MADSDITEYHPFIENEDGDDEHFVLEGCEVDIRAHGADKASEPHTHDETHIIFVRTGEMRWEVDGEEFHAEAGDTIVTPPETEHKFEVVGDEPANTTCLIAPDRSAEDRGPSGTHEITKPDEV
jgi:mannose-6-phosphate isomerase-like protein (cupin superfamily)